MKICGKKMDNLKININNELNKKSILVEYDSGYINPNDNRN